MERPLLNDKNEYPDDDVLKKYLGNTKAIWDIFTAQLKVDFPSMALEWRFYDDGKAWLGKLVYKKKTVCWISIWDKYFKIGFYFTEKNDKDIKNLKIDLSLKESYRTSKSFGKLKPLPVKVKTKKALAEVFQLIRYKSQ